MEILNLKSKININCSICEKCCVGRGDLKITPINVLEISKFLKITPAEFIEKYTIDAGGNKPEIKIKAQGKNRLCIFNNPETNKCTIQKVKPMQCVVFPLVPYNLDYDLFVNSNQCPVGSKKYMTVNKWLNGNNKIYSRHKDIYRYWINFVCEISNYWFMYDDTQKEEIHKILYLDYDLSKNLQKQVYRNIDKVKSKFYPIK